MTAPTYKGCKCDWRPKCEAGGPCGEYAVISDWLPDYSTKRLTPKWLCDDHWTVWTNRQDKIKGLDRPANADEYWRPSIMEVVRHGIIALAFEDSREASRPVSTDCRFSWERRLTPAQWKSYQVLRASQQQPPEPK